MLSAQNLLLELVSSSPREQGLRQGPQPPALCPPARVSLLEIAAADQRDVETIARCAPTSDVPDRAARGGASFADISDPAGIVLFFLAARGTGSVAAYAADNVTVDLAAGRATANGPPPNDMLVGIVSAAVQGGHDTLIAGSGSRTMSAGCSGNGAGDTLFSSTSTFGFLPGNTLIGGAGSDTLGSSGVGDAAFLETLRHHRYTRLDEAERLCLALAAGGRPAALSVMRRP